jgi:hypothetical protein
MSAPSRLTPAQQADAAARHRDGRPDKAVMSNAERRQAGLMDRRQAAEHEHLAAAVFDGSTAERFRGPDPDDIWAGTDPGRADDDLPIWKAWQDAGHDARGCDGWSQDFRAETAVCACGEAFPVPEGTRRG